MRKLSPEEINDLPLFHYEGEIKLVKTIEEWRAVLPLLEKETVLGFDTETRPAFAKGQMHLPGLIQLATEDLVCLVQLGPLRFGSAFSKILSDPAIIKAGVGIEADITALAKMHSFAGASLVDLGVIAAQNGLQSHGLRTLAADLFGWRISKGCRCSNWNAPQLSQRQITYAATDAWISRKIYLRFKEMGLAGLDKGQ